MTTVEQKRRIPGRRGKSKSVARRSAFPSVQDGLDAAMADEVYGRILRGEEKTVPFDEALREPGLED